MQSNFLCDTSPGIFENNQQYGNQPKYSVNKWESSETENRGFSVNCLEKQSRSSLLSEMGGFSSNSLEDKSGSSLSSPGDVQGFESPQTSLKSALKKNKDREGSGVRETITKSVQFFSAFDKEGEKLYKYFIFLYDFLCIDFVILK